jgi:hypothetical protein
VAEKLIVHFIHNGRISILPFFYVALEQFSGLRSYSMVYAQQQFKSVYGRAVLGGGFPHRTGIHSTAETTGA